MRSYLPARLPFSLSAVVESHGWFQLPPFGWSRPASAEAADRKGADERSLGTLSRVERLSSGRVVEIQVREGDDGVLVETPDRLAENERREVSDRVNWMLQLDRDLTEFYALVEDEPRLAHLRGTARGRILRSPTVFEDVVKTILTTNVQWSGTVRMVSSVVERFGAPLPADQARRAFPTPERLATADDASLRSAGLGYRAPYVLELARSVAAGDRRLEALKEADLPTKELRRRLLGIRGVGNYAAANLLMLLGRCDFVPVDSWARTMVSGHWHHGEPAGDAEVEAAFERWGRWRGLAYWFWKWD